MQDVMKEFSCDVQLKVRPMNKKQHKSRPMDMI